MTMLFVRWVLELVVMVTLVVGVIKLYDDWHKITPPVWRWIILAYQGVVVANVAAILVSITQNRELTWATWLLLASYIFLMLPLVFERLVPKPLNDQRHMDSM